MYHFTNGDVYDGDWVSNRMEGKGLMLYKSGAKYDGEWR